MIYEEKIHNLNIDSCSSKNRFKLIFDSLKKEGQIKQRPNSVLEVANNAQKIKDQYKGKKYSKIRIEGVQHCRQSSAGGFIFG